MMDMQLIGASILSGAIGGILYGVVGYAKNKKDITNEFDITSLATTVLGSAVIGAASAYMGLPYDAVANGAFGVFFTQITKKIISILLNRS